MTLKIYNTFTAKKEEFIPIKKGQVLFYVCGVTVYDHCHIGHARAYVVFDTIRRYLEHLKYKVKYVQNFTDVDDKIIARANERNMDYKELTKEFIKEYFEDMEKLNIKKADLYPKATEYIKQMQQIIAKLIKDEKAYILDGDVYFSVAQFKDYGKLSKKVIEDFAFYITVRVYKGRAVLEELFINNIPIKDFLSSH